jgi:hypothetical protein
LDPVTIGVRRKLETGTVFLLDYYEHGLSAWSIVGTGMQCQWDTTHHAGLLVWSHPTNDMGAKSYQDRQKDAEQFLQTYNAWANGDVWGYVAEIVTRCETCGGEVTEDLGGCWGFYGPYAKTMIEDIKSAVVRAGFKTEDIEYVGDGAYLAD